jgi:HEAT repeat protein
LRILEPNAYSWLFKPWWQVDVVVPTLIRGLKDEDSGMRQGTAQALKEMGSDAKMAVNALTEALADDHVRFFAAEALGAIGPDAKPAFLALLKIANERHAEGKPFWWARNALMRIDANAVAQAGVPEDR